MSGRQEDPRPHPTPSSEEWGRRLRLGDPEAVGRVRERVRRILSARRLAIATDEREDLEQDVMTEVWRAVNRSGFDLAGGFWGFVEVVASRRCIDYRRARRDVTTLDEEHRDGAAGPFESAVTAQRTDLASRILARLEPPCRQLVTMRLHDGMSFREIAQVLGRSEGALRVQMHRCIAKARDIADDLESDRRSAEEEQPRATS